MTTSGAGGPWVNTDRVANYWSTSLVPRNASQATRDTVDVVAVDPGAGSGGSHRVDDDDTRDAVLPPTGVVRTYDEDGNPLSDGLYTYEWDAENRLVAMETAATTIWSGVERRRYEHTYDHLHRRIRTSTQANVGSWFQIRSQTFVYDGWNLIRESINDTDMGVSYARTYAWGLDIMGSLSGSGGVQGLAVMHDSHTSTVYLPGYDANGNVAVLVNEDDGSIEAAYEYGPFGELLRQEGDYAEANPFRFSTKYWDEETDLIYYGRRYYDPKDGRFVGRDPIEEQGGLNLYAFVANNTVNAWDYLGMNSTKHSNDKLNGYYAGDEDSDGDGIPDHAEGNQMDPVEVLARTVSNLGVTLGGGFTQLSQGLTTTLDVGGETDLENSIFVSSDDEDPCAGIKSRLESAREIKSRTAASFEEGGEYHVFDSIFEGLSAAEAGGLVNAMGGLAVNGPISSNYAAQLAVNGSTNSHGITYYNGANLSTLNDIKFTGGLFAIAGAGIDGYAFGDAIIEGDVEGVLLSGGNIGTGVGAAALGGPLGLAVAGGQLAVNGALAGYEAYHALQNYIGELSAAGSAHTTRLKAAAQIADLEQQFKDNDCK